MTGDRRAGEKQDDCGHGVLPAPCRIRSQLGGANALQTFVEKHDTKVVGSLSCVDRVIFKGHSGLEYPAAREGSHDRQGVLSKDFKEYAPGVAEQIKANALAVAKRAGRPYEYLSRHERKEERELGFMHVRVQSGFPVEVQVYVNGHEWRARKLEAAGRTMPSPGLRTPNGRSGSPTALSSDAGRESWRPSLAG